MALTRRDFLALSAVLMSGTTAGARPDQGGLDSFAMAGPPCAPDAKPTPALAPDRTYKRGAPVRAAIADVLPSDVPLQLSGTVTGIRCGRIANADVEVWHADTSGAFDMTGFRGRGRQTTGKEGQFLFRTILPGISAGRARHIGIHVSVPSKTELWTELFFPNEPSNVRDPRFKPELVMTVRTEGRTRIASFDVLLDL